MIQGKLRLVVPFLGLLHGQSRPALDYYCHPPPSIQITEPSGLSPLVFLLRLPSVTDSLLVVRRGDRVGPGHRADTSPLVGFAIATTNRHWETSTQVGNADNTNRSRCLEPACGCRSHFASRTALTSTLPLTTPHTQASMNRS
ncbi:hypothetical protein BDW66DRAFT_33850 [Aspergillus desertorum]